MRGKKMLKPTKGCKLQESTVMFDKAGTLRIASDLIPEELRDKPLAFLVRLDPHDKFGGVVTLIPMERNGAHGRVGDGGYILKAWKPSPTSKSPLVSAIALLNSLCMAPPKKVSRLFVAKVVDVTFGGVTRKAIRFDIPPYEQKTKK
jgi:hypothetical protein